MSQAYGQPERKSKGKAFRAVSGKAETHVQPGAAGEASRYIRAFRVFARALFKLVFRVRVKGLSNLPAGAPAIICANHLGWADVFLIELFLPIEPRIYVLGEQEVKYISSFRTRIIDSLQIMVMLDRDKPREALRITGDVLKRGGSLLIFPEGELGMEEGRLRELQHGAAHMSLLTGAPLVPVGLTGPSELWLRRTLTVRIGQPVMPTSFNGDTRARMHAMTEQVSTKMQVLLPGDYDHPRIKLLRGWLTHLF
ncbi:MAG: 1-acyl-sn-glycerol-3-phosphate acyltransferase [Chloroflexota bacterium]|nr:1-acyl-sn-glycerol-3-phosphate acyltransferase [Chloroflexota bacterium]